MNVIYQIAGYDKQTMRLVCEYDVPEGSLSGVMEVAHVSLEEAAEFGSVLLDRAAVQNIGRQLNKNIYSELCDWVLEPFSGSNAERSPLPHYRV